MNQIDEVKDIADGMIGIGGIPSNEEFYAEFNFRVKSKLGIKINENLSLKKTELEQIINNIKDLNPYPVNIFPEPIDDDWDNVGKFLKSHGKNPDRIFAKWGRMVWNNCVNCMEDYLPELKL